MTDAESVVAALRERGLTLATAESLTAGLLASTIAEVPGCSAVLRGGVVAYSSDVKASVLGVDARLLEHVVSEQVAARMALGATQVLSADIGVGTTGAAGPASLDGQAPGTVWIANACGTLATCTSPALAAAKAASSSRKRKTTRSIAGFSP